MGVKPLDLALRSGSESGKLLELNNSRERSGVRLAKAAVSLVKSLSSFFVSPE